MLQQNSVLGSICPLPVPDEGNGREEEEGDSWFEASDRAVWKADGVSKGKRLASPKGFSSSSIVDYFRSVRNCQGGCKRLMANDRLAAELMISMLLRDVCRQMSP